MLFKVDDDVKRFFTNDFMIRGDNISVNKKEIKNILSYVAMCMLLVYSKLDKKDKEKYFKIIVDFIENNINNLIFNNNICISFHKDFIISQESIDEVFNNLLYLFFEISKKDKRFRKYLYGLLMVN